MGKLAVIAVAVSLLFTLAGSFISVRQFGIPVLILLSVFVIFSSLMVFLENLRSRLSPRTTEFFLKGTLVALAFPLIFVYADYLIYPNFIFSKFHIHIGQSFNTGLLMSLYAVLSLNRRFVKKHSGLPLTVFPLWLLAAVSYFWLYYPDVYSLFKIEDSAVEYFTFLAFLISGIFSLIGFLNLIRNNTVKAVPGKNLYASVFLLIAFSSWMIAAEEISWGQRLFGFATPEQLSFINEQGEFNLHNTRGIQGRLYFFYFLFCLYASFANRIMARSENRLVRLILYFAPPGSLRYFFLPLFIFSLSRLISFIPQYPNYPEETLEFLLAAGLAASMYHKQKNLPSG